VAGASDVIAYDVHELCDKLTSSTSADDAAAARAQIAPQLGALLKRVGWVGRRLRAAT